MAISWDFPEPFTHSCTVSSSEIDGLGHTNNTIYIQWCEQTAWQHSESLGLGIREYQSLDRGVAVHRSEFDYLLPSFEGDSIIIGTWLTKTDNRLNMERRFQVCNQATEQTLCRGLWKFIAITLSTGKPTRMPKEFVDIYGKAVISSD